MNLVKRKQENRIPSIFEDLFNPENYWDRLADVANFGSTLPAVNIKENPENFTVEVAIPGKAKEDFTIELNEDMLTISSESKTENTETSEDLPAGRQGGRYTRKEFNYASFRRAFHLPETVEQDKIEAKYENGILMVEVPKKEEVKAKAVKRMIAVS